jgi:uncharacterized protein (TIGR00251 family)
MLTIRVRVSPNARRTELLGLSEGGAIRIKVAAQPVEGQANKALVQWLSDTLLLPKSRIEIVRGISSRDKVLNVDTPLTASELLIRLGIGR